MFNREEWKVLGLLLIVHFCLIVDFMVVMPQAPQLMRVFGIEAQMFSGLVASYTFGAGFMGIASAFFIDRFDRKKSLLFLFASFAISNLLCAVAPGYWTFVLARFITGATGGVTGTILFAIVSDAIDPKKRSTAFGFLFSAFALASIIGVPICLLLATRFTWQMPFLLIFCFSMLTLVALWIFLPAFKTHISDDRLSFKDFKDLAIGSGRWMALFFTALLIIGHFSINPFLFASLVMNGGLPEAQLPTVYLIVGFLSVVSSIFFGKMSDAFGRRRVFSIALLASLGATYAVTNLKPASFFELTFAISSFMILMGGRLAPAMTLVSELALPRNRGRFLSLVGGIQQLATAAAAAIAGGIVTKTSDGKILHFSQVGYIAIAVSLIALAVSYKLTPLESRQISNEKAIV